MGLELQYTLEEGINETEEEVKNNLSYHGKIRFYTRKVIYSNYDIKFSEAYKERRERIDH